MSQRKWEICENDRKLFPIEDIQTVLKLFSNNFDKDKEPDLVLLSLVVGAIENSITLFHTVDSTAISNNSNSNFNKNLKNKSTNESQSLPSVIRLPVLQLDFIESLYEKFHNLFIDSFNEKIIAGKPTKREQVKKIADIVWNTLTRSYYKDRAHLQSLFSFLNGKKLDCFGVAFAVVAGCQVLGLNDVHLMLSEDHAWVSFGKNGCESAEVTWHGKGNEDKRGQPIKNSTGSWLYVNNYPVICTRQMEVAALISAMNPSLNSNSDAYEVAVLQQQLLWLAYDYGCLSKYPMALGNLGDLEEVSATIGRPHCTELFKEGIISAKQFYNNQHVYPYTFQGGYCYRHKMYKEALNSWADASDVIKKYNYSREDEEIYKEFLEIANELIPNIIKIVSFNQDPNSIIHDPDCFSYLLRFYDGICCWEEGSSTPVLHIGWAKSLCNTFSKFDSLVRSNVIIITSDENNLQDNNDAISNSDEQTSDNTKNVQVTNCENKVHETIVALTAGCSEKILNPEFLLQGDGSPFVSSVDTNTSNQNNEIDNMTISKMIEGGKPSVILFSEKMKGLKRLILSEKLNTQAISLQLTAQSQVQISKRSRGVSDYHYNNKSSLKTKRIKRKR